MDEQARRLAHVQQSRACRALKHRRETGVIAHQWYLRRSLLQLRQLATAGGPIDSNSLNRLLNIALGSTSGIGLYLSQTLRSLPYNDLVRGGRGAAKRVFDIPELLEMIIDQLSPLDILRVQKLNRQWRDAVNSSVHVQRKLFLAPPLPNTPFHAPFHDVSVLPGFRTSHTFIANSATNLANPLTILETRKMRFVARFCDLQDTPRTSRIPKDVGSRICKMQICHPPVTNLEAYTNCCNGINSQGQQRAPPTVVGKISNPKGITIGDLWTKAKEILHQHKNCPSANEIEHNIETGEVIVQITFRIDTELDDEHELVKARRHQTITAVQTQQAKLLRYRPHILALRLFLQAKRAARGAGQPIPTFEEFKATSSRAEA